MARKLLKLLEPAYLRGLSRHLENPNTLAVSLTRFLVTVDECIENAATPGDVDAQVDRLVDAIRAVNHEYERSHHKALRNGACHGIFAASVHFAMKTEGLNSSLLSGG